MNTHSWGHSNGCYTDRRENLSSWLWARPGNKCDVRDKCVEANPTTNTKMRQALDILKRGMQRLSINFEKQHEYKQYISKERALLVMLVVWMCIAWLGGPILDDNSFVIWWMLPLLVRCVPLLDMPCVWCLWCEEVNGTAFCNCLWYVLYLKIVGLYV